MHPTISLRTARPDLRQPRQRRRIGMTALPAVLAIALIAVLVPLPASAQTAPDALWSAPSPLGTGPDGLGALLPGVVAKRAASAVPATPAVVVVPAADVAPPEEVAPQPPVFARALGIELRLPHQTTAVGFHESGNRLAAIMEPIGLPVENLNVGRITVEANAPDPHYRIMSTRGRRPGPTTAVDLAIAPGVAVTSPLDGVITDVREYLLYGRSTDVLVDLQPHGRPDVRVRVMHLEGPLLNIGDHVVAGVTPLASGARVLPFPSQIDRYVHHDAPAHAHVEVHHLTSGT